MKKDFKTPKRGFVFKDGKLFEFRRDWVAVSKPWPPVRHQKTRKRPFWHYGPVEKMAYSYYANKYSVCAEKGLPFHDDPAYISPDWSPKWLPVLAKFYDPIPLEVRETVLSCGTNVETPWNIFAFFARCGDAADVMRCSPAIGFMLANLPVFRKGVKRRWEQARRLARKQRREILGFLGWPDSEAMAKILSRIPLKSCCKKPLLQLRALVRRRPEIIKPLSHMKELNTLSLDVICTRKLREKAGWRFISELAVIKNFEEDFGMRRMFGETIRMEEMLHLPSGPVRSVEHLLRRHDRAVEQMNKVELAAAERKSWFPEPPVPVPPPTPDFEIFPLDTPVKLCQEGIEQHNCVYVYCDDVARCNGDIYIYSVTRPERATLKIEKMDGRRGYFISEIKGPCNKEVAGSTVDAVRRWLYAFHESLISDDIREAILDARPHPAMQAPLVEGIEASQICDPRSIVDIMLDYSVKFDVAAVRDVISGRTSAFLLSKPSEGLLLVSRNGTGGFSYTPRMRHGRLDYTAEKLLDGWISRLEELNFPTDIPGQMHFEFGSHETQAFAMAQRPELQMANTA